MTFIKRTRRVALALVATLASSALIQVQSASQTVVDDTGMNPGFAIRLEQKTVDGLKTAMQEFLPNYIEHDAKMPSEYDYKIGMEAGFLTDLFTWKYHWQNIKYSDARFDFRDIKLVLNNALGAQMLKVDFPALKEWKIDALQTSNSWLLPESSYVELEFTDFDVNFNTQLQLLSTGFLKPVVYEIQIKFGNSYFYHQNAIVAFVMNQFVEFAIVVIENSTYFVGQYIFSSLLGPMMSQFLNDYKFNIDVNKLPGQPGIGDQLKDYRGCDYLTLDYRHTHKPYIGDGFIDMFMVGDIKLNENENCDIKPDPLNFMADDKFSQLVITESMMTCLLNQLAKSCAGKIDLNEERFNKLFFTEGIKIDSQSIYEHLPIFQNKLGQGSDPQPLQIDMSFSNIEVLFGQFDTDVILKYKLHIAFSIEGGKELLYDEIDMITSADIEARNDIGFIKMLNNKINGHSNRKKLPMRNSMDIKPSEYREFMSTFGFTMNFMKKWMNEVVLRRGLRFPFKMEELETELKFMDKQMHVLLDVNSNAAHFFEKEFWASAEDVA